LHLWMKFIINIIVAEIVLFSTKMFYCFYNFLLNLIPGWLVIQFV
jgi:hypothetical protein